MDPSTLIYIGVALLTFAIGFGGGFAYFRVRYAETLQKMVAFEDSLALREQEINRLEYQLSTARVHAATPEQSQADNQRLRNDINAKTREIADLKAQHEQQTTDLQREIDVLKAHMSELEVQQYSIIEDEKEVLHEMSADVHTQKAELQEEAARIARERASLEQARKDYEAARAALQAEQNTEEAAETRGDTDAQAHLTATLQQLETEREALEYQRQDLEQERAFLDEERETLEQERAFLDEEQARIQQQKTFLFKQQEAFNEERVQAQATTAAQADLSATEQHLHAEREALARERTQLAEEQAALAQQKADVEEQQALVAQEHEHIRETEATFAQREAQLQEAESQLAERHQALANDQEIFSARIQQLKQERTKLVDRHHKLEQAKKTYLSRRANLEKREKDLLKARADLEEQGRAIHLREKQIKVDRKLVDNEKAVFAEECAKFEEQKEALAAQRVEHEKRMNTLVEIEQRIEEQRIELADEKSFLEQEAEALEKRKVALEKREAVLKSQRETLEHEQAALEEEKEQLTSDRDAFEEELDAFHERVRALDEREAFIEESEAELERVRNLLDSSQDLQDLRTDREARPTQSPISSAEPTAPGTFGPTRLASPRQPEAPATRPPKPRPLHTPAVPQAEDKLPSFSPLSDLFGNGARLAHAMPTPASSSEIPVPPPPTSHAEGPVELAHPEIYAGAPDSAETPQTPPAPLPLGIRRSHPEAPEYTPPAPGPIHLGGGPPQSHAPITNLPPVPPSLSPTATMPLERPRPLDKIAGLDFNHAMALNALGIDSYEVLANLTSADVRHLAPMLQISPETIKAWITQAQGMLFGQA